MQKQEHKQKLTWTRPQLVVIGRSHPEESVLYTCKYPSLHTGPANPNCKVPGSGFDCQDVLPS
jgi:hypothetical protein